MATIPAEIFKAYDIRGIVDKTLTSEGVETIGRAIGSEARARSVKSVVVGRDGRLSGPDLSQALARGLQAAGIDVIDSVRTSSPAAAATASATSSPSISNASSRT